MGKREFRIDFAGETLQPPQRTADGFLHVDGLIARTGVQVYRDADGREWREYRPPSEVFAEESINSFKGVPVTDDHPHERVTPHNYKRYAVGSSSESVRKHDDTWLAARLFVQDATAQGKVEAGKNELSNGYTAEVVEEPGVTPEGEHYDTWQREIRGNHIAIVHAARAGPDARMRMDDAAVAVSNNTRSEVSSMGTTKIKVDGVEVEVPEQAAQLIERQATSYKEKLDSEKARADKLQGQLDSETARADSALKDLEREREARKAAEDPARVRARVDLEKHATPILRGDNKEDPDLSEKTDKDIKIAVIKRIDGDDVDSDASDAYVDGRYEGALRRADASVKSHEHVRTTITDAEPAQPNGGKAKEAYAKMQERNRKGYHQERKDAARKRKYGIA